MDNLKKYETQIKNSNLFLQKNNISTDDLVDKIKSATPDFDYNSFIITQINQLTNQIFATSNNSIPLDLEKDFVQEQLKKSEQTPLQFLYFFHLHRSQIAYEYVFKGFKEIIQDEVYFFVLLLDKLRKEFNVELFVTVKNINNCNGFIFELDGTGLKDMMGIALTPLAFESLESFVSTLVHELSHRMMYVENSLEGKPNDSIDHEFNAYFAEHFITKKILDGLPEDFWLDRVFEKDVYRISLEMLKKEEDFMEMVYFKFRAELKIYNTQLLEANGDLTQPTYSNQEIEQMYQRAYNIQNVPKKFRCILDFIWFYSSRLSILHKAGKYKTTDSLLTYFILMFHFASKYEKKYAAADSLNFDNVSFQTRSRIGQPEKLQIQQYIQQIRSLNYE